MPAVLAVGLPLLVAALAACGGGSEATSERKKTPTEATTGTAIPEDPTDCMEEAGVLDVEEAASDMWSGIDVNDGSTITVERKASAAEAKQAVRDAGFVWTARAGPYFIRGGSQEGGDSGVVSLIADCLRAS